MLSAVGFTLVVAAGSLAAGFLGALTGLGGGVVIIPLLVLGLGVDMHYAAGASLISVIATSSGAAAAYVREGYTNLRVGMFLEIATTMGALLGAHLSARTSPATLAIALGCVLMVSAGFSARSKPRTAGGPPDPWGEKLRLDNSYPGRDGETTYKVRRVGLGFAMMSVAGTLSGLLGIGSGALKVLAMDLAMGLPFKVSTTTSNFMIGVTAVASAGVYIRHGYVDPLLAAPVTLGVLAGSLAGSRVLRRSNSQALRKVFAVVIAVLAVEMIYQGVTGKL